MLSHFSRDATRGLASGKGIKKQRRHRQEKKQKRPARKKFGSAFRAREGAGRYQTGLLMGIT
jgi:hypothetical protein